MNPSRTGTIWLIVAILIGFGIELATNSVGDEAALLKLGALPDTGQLHGEFWRIATYSFLHYNWLHLLLNVGLLWWIGRIVESQVGTGRGALIYFVSVLYSAGVSVRAQLASESRRHYWRVGRNFRVVRRCAHHFVSRGQRGTISKIALAHRRGWIRRVGSSQYQHGRPHWRNSWRRVGCVTY
jgi:hypothetical protein